MKRFSIVTMGVALTLLVLNACSDEAPEQMQHPQDDTTCELIFTAKSFQHAGDVNSRTALVMPEGNDEGAGFVWTAGDTIGIAPNEGAQAYFVIGEGAESNKATFSGGSWALKTQNSNDYAAYYPLVYDMMLDRTQVPVDYTGQVYKPAVSNKLSSLASHDYMAAKATVATGANNVNFEFKHLSTLMEIQFAVPEASEVTQVTLTSDEKIFPIKGTFNLEAETVTITSTADDLANSLTIKVKELETTEANEVVSVFFMTPPMDLSGKTLDMTITYGEQEKNLEVTGGVNMSAGMWYTLVAEEYNQQPAYIQLASDFSTSLNDALGTLGGTKLKFVPNSETTSETVVFEDAENGVNAYAVKNGDWLEVHTSAKEFMAPESCYHMFAGTSYTNNALLTEINLIGFNTSETTNMYGMYNGCKSVTSINFGENFTTSKVTSMELMFVNCEKLTSLNLSKFDTSKVKSMRSMFAGCEKLTLLDLSCFDTAEVTNMYEMFRSCKSLTSIVFGESFNTSQVTVMTSMFYLCEKLMSLNLSTFDTSKVKSMAGMFAYCKALTSLDLSNFNTSNVTNMNGMFELSTLLKSITFGKNFNTSAVTHMTDMFSFCYSLTSLDLSSFDTSSATDLKGMFMRCTSLSSLNISSFNTSAAETMNGMFCECYSLPSLDLTNFTFANEVSCINMFGDMGKDCKDTPANIYVTAKGKLYLEEQNTYINSSYAQLVVKDTEP